MVNLHLQTHTIRVGVMSSVTRQICDPVNYLMSNTRADHREQEMLEIALCGAEIGRQFCEEKIFCEV